MTLPTPAYEVRVSFEGATEVLFATHGTLPAMTDPVVLIDGLEFDWEATEGRTPGEFEPSTLSLGLAAFTAADLEHVQPGKLVQVIVVMGGGGPASWALFRTFRVTDVDLSLHPRRRRKVQARVTLADLNADLRSRFPEPASSGPYQRPPELPWVRAITEVVHALGIRLYGPPDISWQIGPGTVGMLPPLPEWPEESADEVMARFFNTVGLSSAEWGTDRHVAVMPLDGTSPPSGWIDLATATTVLSPLQYESADGPAYILAPLDRKVSGTVGLPYRPIASPPSLWSIELAPDAEATQAGIAIIDGCRIEAPAQARRARGAAFTIANLEGAVRGPDDDGVMTTEDGSSEVHGSMVTEYGPITRSIPVMTVVRSTDPATTQYGRDAVRGVAASIAARFLSTPTELGAATQYDEFQVRVSSLDDVIVARRMIQELTPRAPSLTVDAHQTSTAVLIHGIDSDLVPGGEIRGFVVAGKLTIEGGTLTYGATVAPGEPELIAGLSHQLSDVLGAARLNNIDPTLTLADMALTRRF